MIPTSEKTFTHDLEMLDRATLIQVVEAIRADIVVNGTDNLAMEEIAAVYPARRRQK